MASIYNNSANLNVGYKKWTCQTSMMCRLLAGHICVRSTEFKETQDFARENHFACVLHKKSFIAIKMDWFFVYVGWPFFRLWIIGVWEMQNCEKMSSSITYFGIESKNLKVYLNKYCIIPSRLLRLDADMQVVVCLQVFWYYLQCQTKRIIHASILLSTPVCREVCCSSYRHLTLYLSQPLRSDVLTYHQWKIQFNGN